MSIGPEGIGLIKRYESLRLEAYLPTPNDVPTIGWGHTGSDVGVGDMIDADTANDLLLADIRAAEDCIAAHVGPDLLQQQYDALCSFIFNVGCQAFKGSTMCRLINAGNYEGAQKQFARWNRQGRTILAGLTRRRAEEAKLFGRAGNDK